MSLDEKVERAADGLARLSRAAARAGGVRAKLAEPLAEDSELLRQLKPSLIAARARGDGSIDGQPTEPRARIAEASQVEQRPRPQPRPRSGDGEGGGPNPLLVIGAALVLGMALAHVLAWLGERYPRG
ncbi:MAG TPA: hypothetical protein VFI37_15960 [Gaiellaceae bacterium]|jgi:hypothetical protein|nr:hypothetical protein [Gaiellaceae bacterium]